MGEAIHRKQKDQSFQFFLLPRKHPTKIIRPNKYPKNRANIQRTDAIIRIIREDNIQDAALGSL